MKSPRHYVDKINAPMKERMEYVLKRIEKNERGLRVNYIAPDILKRLKQKNLIHVDRVVWTGLNTSHTMAYSNRVIKVEEKRVAEPYKKRREDLKSAGLPYRKSY